MHARTLDEVSLFLARRFLFTLLAGEEVAPQLLQPLADPLELGDADACNVEVVGLKAHL